MVKGLHLLSILARGYAFGFRQGPEYASERSFHKTKKGI